MANKKTSKTEGTETLLVELLTEELPPKALKRLGQEFALKTLDGLASSGLIDSVVDFTFFATPRRLAVQVPNARERAPDTEREVQGPSVNAPAQAVAGFAKKCGVPVEALKKQQTPKGEVYVAHATTIGQTLANVLAGKIEASLKVLPVPKVMRWGNGEARFVRPVHGLVMMHGARVVPGEVLGRASSNQTLGHRSLSSGRITIKHAGDYEQALLKGKVVASYDRRRTLILSKIHKLCGNSSMPVASDALYDEITSLVEAPEAYAGEFGREFLEVPEECLILSMQQHQKYVPLRDKHTGKLLPRFLFVSNVETNQPREIIHGNERVLRARLSDAKFFYDQDRKTRLETRVPRLAKVVYHNKLGSQLERVERIKKLAGTIANELKADVKAAERAAFLCKADLLTDMVGEFPELQGTMGRYYALHDGEPKEVADAIEQHYRPRFAGDALPQSKVATAVALAEKVDGLVGIFGIGQAPSGDKDPFALRRAALGVVRIVAEQRLPISLEALISDAASGFSAVKLNIGEIGKIHGFMLERLRSFLKDAGYRPDEIEAVVGSRMDRVIPVIKAVRDFRSLPEAESLAGANKRIRNILRQQNYEGSGTIRDSLLNEPAERALHDEIQRLLPRVDESLQREDFGGALCALAGLKGTVDTFFDKVLVNAEDQEVRKNRLALLAELSGLMNQVADISKLAA
jgi:glycyl-tRNA synthetase beta chain